MLEGEIRRSYDEDGAVCLRSVVSEDVVAGLRQATERFRANPKGRHGEVSDAGGGRFFIANFLSEHDEGLRDFVLHGPLPALAKELTQASVVRFFYDQLFAKDPGANSPTPWHNDEPFWPIRGEQTISLWVALTPVREDSGGVEYVAGSHLWKRRFRPVRPGESDPPSGDDGMEAAPDFDRPELRAAHRMLRWDLNPGDVLCHHPLTLHGAAGNRTASLPRIGFSVRYFGPDARWTPGPYAMPLSKTPGVTVGDYPDDDEVFPVVA